MIFLGVLGQHERKPYLYGYVWTFPGRDLSRSQSKMPQFSMHSYASIETIADETTSTVGLHEVVRKSKEIKDNKLAVLAARARQMKGNRESRIYL